jgi:hypothetical protein
MCAGADASTRSPCNGFFHPAGAELVQAALKRARQIDVDEILATRRY